MAPIEGGARSLIISVITYVDHHIAGGTVFRFGPNFFLPPAMGAHLSHSLLIPGIFENSGRYRTYVGNTSVLELPF